MITNQSRNDELKRLSQIYNHTAMSGPDKPQTTRPQSGRITPNQPVSAFGTSNNRYGLSQTTKPRRFQSRYINDDGKWTQNAVNDGFVEFNDYINDIKDDYKGISFNDKPMQVNNPNKSLEQYSINDNYNNQAEMLSFSDVFDRATEYVEDISKAVSDKAEYGKDFIASRFNQYKWTSENFGYKVASEAFGDGNKSNAEAKKMADKYYNGVEWNNGADAYRHFIWNVKMTRNKGVGYYNSRNITNRYEYEHMKEQGWLKPGASDFNYLKDNTIIKTKMNQENLMDLWNNQVGRELANNKALSWMNEKQLYNFAKEHNLLITDANIVYEFLGVTEYISDMASYTVDTEWNLTTGNVTFTKGKKRVTLKIGV